MHNTLVDIIIFLNYHSVFTFTLKTHWEIFSTNTFEFCESNPRLRALGKVLPKEFGIPLYTQFVQIVSICSNLGQVSQVSLPLPFPLSVCLVRFSPTLSSWIAQSLFNNPEMWRCGWEGGYALITNPQIKLITSGEGGVEETPQWSGREKWGRWWWWYRISRKFPTFFAICATCAPRLALTFGGSGASAAPRSP